MSRDPRRVSVLGCDIHIAEAGAGPPILFLHGNPDSSQLWAPVAKHLASSFHCLMPDLPGFGRSSVAARFDYSLAGLSAFVDALCDALRLYAPVHLVGHDFGGIAGAAWMATHPQRVRSFTSCNAIFTPACRWHGWARVWRTPLVGELSMLAMNRWVFGVALRRGSRQLTPGQLDAAYALITPTVKRAVLRLYRAVRPASFKGWDARFLQAARAIPVTVLWGEGDPYFADSFAETWGARRVVRVAGAGHWLPAVEPVRVAEELRSFLNGAT